MDESEENSSMDSLENGSPSSPQCLVTPRIPVMREEPLSTKREKLKETPKFRKPAPKVVKTAPAVRSFYSVMRDPRPRFIARDGNSYPLFSPAYDRKKVLSFFEQVFAVQELIGKGSFGEVFSALSREDNRLYAIKVSIQLLRHNCASKFREVENHMSLPPHPNLVRFQRAWEEAGRLYIQTELCEMSLLHYCMQKHIIPEKVIWNIFIDLLRAIHHLHSHDMIHDDIKPDNIFLTNDLVCKLGDFGLAINLKNPRDVQSAEEGDSKYLAPEVLNGQPTKSSDIFSLGMTILEAATDLDMPSNGRSWHLIRQGEIPDRFFEGISQELRDLIERMLNRDASLRPTTTELLENPAIQKRLMVRRFYIKYIHTRDSFTNFLFVLLTWGMAFFAVLFQHPIAMFQAVSDRRSAICANMSNHLQQQQEQQQQQHTPIQTPEGSKAFAESLTDNTAISRNQTAPFDFSDDENSANQQHIQRRLFAAPPPVSRFSLEDDDDEEPATSSSNSSAIESTSSPIRHSLRNQNNWITGRQGTPKSARKIVLPPFGARPTTPAVSSTTSPTSSLYHHGGSGDGFNNEDRAAWMSAKYERMMRMEARLDSDDNDNDIVDETPLIQMPVSCPPIGVRQGRRFKAPKLDFSLLDGDDKDEKPSTSANSMAVPTTAISQKSKNGRIPMRMAARSRMVSFQGSSGDEI